LGIGDWGLGIGDWGLGPIPNPQSPIPMYHKIIYDLFKIISFNLYKNQFLFINKNKTIKKCLMSMNKMIIMAKVTI
jgi:hypothetical protein